jgi:di/tricarboxylate transporter
MILTAIAAGFVAFLLLAGLFAVGFLVLKRKIQRSFLEFVTAPGKDQPSAFALIVQSIASTFGSEISAHLKATFLGLQSVEAKNERREVAAGIIGNNAVLSAILASFPAVGKKLGKNPALAGLAEMAVNKFMSPKSAPAGGSSPAVQFKM